MEAPELAQLNQDFVHNEIPSFLIVRHDFGSKPNVPITRDETQGMKYDWVAKGEFANNV